MARPTPSIYVTSREEEALRRALGRIDHDPRAHAWHEERAALRSILAKIDKFKEKHHS